MPSSRVLNGSCCLPPVPSIAGNFLGTRAGSVLPPTHRALNTFGAANSIPFTSSCDCCGLTVKLRLHPLSTKLRPASVASNLPHSLSFLQMSRSEIRTVGIPDGRKTAPIPRSSGPVFRRLGLSRSKLRCPRLATASFIPLAYSRVIGRMR